MIRVEELKIKFDGFNALNGVSCDIPDASVWGLVGSNGAGKSTLLRALCGIYKPSAGRVLIDGATVYENPDVKKKVFFVSDEPYLLPTSCMRSMAKIYSAAYPSFSYERFESLARGFGLDTSRNISQMSKGMRRQAATVLALSVQADYMLFDETFDGLDPVMRDLVKRTLYAGVAERGATVIIASHSLRELEDTCDRLALIHKGNMVLQSEVQTLKTGVFKAQIAFSDDGGLARLEEIRNSIVNYSQLGAVITVILKGDKDRLLGYLRGLDPLLLEVLPLSLEEVFVYEMEALGYAFHDVIS